MKPIKAIKKNFFLISILSVLFSSYLILSASASSIPPRELKGVCPIGCCKYGKWIADKEVEVFGGKDRAQIAFKVKRGEKVTAISGDVLLNKNGRAEVMRKTKIENVHARPGDKIHLLYRIGEGYWKIWFKGKVLNLDVECVDVNPPGTFKIISDSDWIWLVKIKNGKGQIGWAEADGFSGKSCHELVQ